VQLGCSADKLRFEVFSKAGACVARWEEPSVQASEGLWVHGRYPGGLDLPNGIYHIKATAMRGETRSHAISTMMLLR
jgi:hypothetical protein